MRYSPKIVFVVTEDWFFCSHFLPMARAARDAGFEVAVVARYDRHRPVIEAEGLRPVPLAWHRRSLNPLRTVQDVVDLAALLRREAPDIVHNVALKPVVLGTAACALAGVRRTVNAVTGMGYVFTDTGLKARLLRGAIALVLGRIGRRRGNRFLVENRDHEREFAALTDPDRVARVPGAGVDLDAFRQVPPPDRTPVSAALVARMIRIKGVEVAVEAVRRLADAGVPITLKLVGEPDDDNHGPIPRTRLEEWSRHPAIRWLGRRDDIPALWADTDIAVLPSLGGDGLPKALLEAAACGRPIVTTDTAGCREVVVPGENGWLVPPGDAGALAAALERLAGDRDMRTRFGEASRRLAERGFAERIVAGTVLALYRDLLADPCDSRHSTVS